MCVQSKRERSFLVYYYFSNTKNVCSKQSGSCFLIYYLCDFVVRDIKIAVYLESPREINFNLKSDFLSK